MKIDSTLRIKRELGRVQRSLLDKKTPAELKDRLYAVQQALTWVLDPQVAMRPHKCVMQFKAHL